MIYWKPVPGYEGLYEVSSTGLVKALEKVRDYKTHTQTAKERLLRFSNNGRGYKQCVLYKEGKTKTFKVHRLVALAFISNPCNHPQINHKDQNKVNNNFSNLEWCTNQYNASYTNSKTYRFVSPTGIGVQIHNLNRFCKENKLTIANMHKVLRQERSMHKGWTRWQDS